MPPKSQKHTERTLCKIARVTNSKMSDTHHNKCLSVIYFLPIYDYAVKIIKKEDSN